MPYLTVTAPLDDVLARTTQQLNGEGIQIEQTFDLKTARLPHIGCQCPHHGTGQCSCQMVVLLVRYEGINPMTVIFHGSDGQTNLSIIDNHDEQREKIELSTIIREVLDLQNIESA
jgi:hypothetical protein